MKKKIAVIIRRTPFNTIRNIEGLRMAVGATLRDDSVTVIFLDEGVRHAGQLHSGIVGAKDTSEEIEMLKMIAHSLVVDKDAAKARNVELLSGIEPISHDMIAELIADSDIVIPW
ncbi:MAG: DsrE family protein [Methanosarcinaceae archaeon]|nr:DsrE family protein [Methanosarcinaceae archaeon]